jgi:hypothetical protein
VENHAQSDGFHLYDHTNPLTIPLTFRLHAAEDYSVNGPETILQIAAKLHALTLPIIKGSTSVTRATSSAALPNGQSSSAEAVGNAAGSSTSSTSSNFDSVSSTKDQKYFFPPACVLNLMVGSNGGEGSILGIVCVGYVRAVRVLLKGPWLSSDDGSVNRNLPTAAEFGLTFVHAPSYTNSLDLLTSDSAFDLVQIGADAMRKGFYNTVSASSKSSVGYKGLLSAN